jgi:endogenous inhibitor of DNA gyrase (YacG/DUF329 family)
MATHLWVNGSSEQTRCKRCGKVIPPVAQQHSDPFCSRVCAEVTYGTGAWGASGRVIAGGFRTPTT